ncbi:MAG: bicyclomycin resistance protein [Betaproteobacteria bacterium]|nr:bicyclomycin resistance protein [Betaproteobacteria bacterium]
MKRFLLVLCCVLGLTGIAHAGPKVLRLAFTLAETGFDPVQISDIYSGAIIANIMEAPLTYDYLARPIKLKPQTLTAMPEVDAEHRTFTLKVRPGILFADDAAFAGHPRELVAEDYAYSLKRVFDPRWKSPAYSSWRTAVLGLDELRQRALRTAQPFDYDAAVDGLQVLDRYTLRIRLARSSPRFLYALTQLPAVAREVVERYGDDIMEHPVGTGPFRLAEWRRSSRIVLERNPRFREQRFDETPSPGDAEALAISRRLAGRRLPLLDRIEISIIAEAQPLWLAFLNGDFDLIELPYEFVAVAAAAGHIAPYLARQGIRLYQAPSPDTVFTYFNMEDPVVGGYTPEKVALRRAISLAYDIPLEIRLLRKGLALPAQSVVPPLTGGYDPALRTEMSQYSPARAKALLDMYGYADRDGDGWREQPDGQPLVLRYYTQTDAGSRAFSELWRKHMNAVGLRIEFIPGQWPEQFKQARAGKLMMWFLSWTTPVPDAEPMLAMMYGPNKGAENLSRFSLPAYDRIFEQIRALEDGPERDALIRQALQLSTAYMPLKTHVHRITPILAQRWLVGFMPHPFLNTWRFLDVEPDVGVQRTEPGD